MSDPLVNVMTCCGHGAGRHLWSGGCNDCQCPRPRPGSSTPADPLREALLMTVEALYGRESVSDAIEAARAALREPAP